MEQVGDPIRLALLVGEVAEHRASEVGDALDHLLTRVNELAGADRTFAVVAHRRPTLPCDDALGRWRPALLHHAPSDVATVRRWLAKPSNLLDDPHTKALMRGMGRARALRRVDALPDERWFGSPGYQLAQQLGVGSRLMLAVPAAVDVEVFVGLDRSVGSRRFSEAERDQAVVLAFGIRPACRRIARLLGVHDGKPPLPPRQREVLRHLLDGLSEKEIAARLGITNGTLHQYVVALYRRYGVQSRPELMVQLLGSPANEPSAGPVPFTSGGGSRAVPEG